MHDFLKCPGTNSAILAAVRAFGSAVLYRMPGYDIMHDCIKLHRTSLMNNDTQTQGF